ncbi:hypothetical protein CN918_25310 [Priestia megaterium]|nr:hypothetical protein CN918_25310 [Priestia megaterium]
MNIFEEKDKIRTFGNPAQTKKQMIDEINALLNSANNLLCGSDVGEDEETVSIENVRAFYGDEIKEMYKREDIQVEHSAYSQEKNPSKNETVPELPFDKTSSHKSESIYNNLQPQPKLPLFHVAERAEEFENTENTLHQTQHTQNPELEENSDIYQIGARHYEEEVITDTSFENEEKNSDIESPYISSTLNTASYLWQDRYKEEYQEEYQEEREEEYTYPASTRGNNAEQVTTGLMHDDLSLSYQIKEYEDETEMDKMSVKEEVVAEDTEKNKEIAAYLSQYIQTVKADETVDTNGNEENECVEGAGLDDGASYETSSSFIDEKEDSSLFMISEPTLSEEEIIEQYVQQEIKSQKLEQASDEMFSLYDSEPAWETGSQISDEKEEVTTNESKVEPLEEEEKVYTSSTYKEESKIEEEETIAVKLPVIISVDCERNDERDIAAGGSEYLGYDFIVDENQMEEMGRYIAYLVQKHSQPLHNMSIQYNDELREEHIWTVDQIEECIAKGYL